MDPLLFVRTITAFVPLRAAGSDEERVAEVARALRFLLTSFHSVQKAGFLVQTVRIATDSFEVCRMAW